MSVHGSQMPGQFSEWETVPSFELEQDSRNRLHEFRDSLSRASGACYRIFDESLFDTEAHENEAAPDKPINLSMAAAVKEQLLHCGNEFYTTADYRWLAEIEIDRFDVIRSAKAETSAHGVFFGAMINSETGITLPLAIKPCKENPAKAYLDWLNNSLIARAGRRRFEPVGFIYDSDIAYSLTKIERGVETLDNTVWNDVLMDPRSEQYKEEREQLAELARELADLHEKRIIHGDPQFKNAAIDTAGNLFYTDWESAKFYGSKAALRILADGQAEDMEKLYYSAAASEAHKGVGLLTPYHKSVQWLYFNQFILTPYIEARLDRDSSAANIEVLGEIEKRVESYALKEFATGSLKRFFRRKKA